VFDGMSRAQVDRADQLMRDSFVHDYMGLGEPWVMTPRLEAFMNESFAAGQTARVVSQKMVFERIAELEQDASAREILRAYWATTGINSVTLTLRGTDELPGRTELLLEEISLWHRRIQASGYLAFVGGAADAERAWRDGKIGLLFALQDTTCLPRDVGVLDTLFALGVRVIQLTYNLRNFLGDGCTERTQAGLSHLGLEFVRHMNEIGIVVDVSHCGYDTTIDAIQASSLPIAMTHTLSKTVREHVRAKSDEQVKLLAEHDGYLGVTTVPFFVSNENGPSLSLFFDHFDYLVKIVGERRIGLASDWGSWSADFPEPLRAIRPKPDPRDSRPTEWLALASGEGGAYFKELRKYSDFGLLARGLVSRGYDDEAIRGFLGQNWLAFLRRAGLK
jgi:membrane dipeptidase